MMQKRTLRGIANLQAGTTVKGNGDLNFRPGGNGDNQTGVLPHALNRMAANLRTVTASRTELEEESIKPGAVKEGLRFTDERPQERARMPEREIEKSKPFDIDTQPGSDKLVGILNSMEDGVCIISRDFGIEYVNPSVASRYGRVDGKNCYQYFYDTDKVCPGCNNREVFSGKTLRREVESSRTGRSFEIVDTPLKNPDGSISKLTVFHDITEHKKTERIKDEFAGIVSHELKNQLTVIIGALNTANDKKVPGNIARELLGDAITSAETLANVVDNLLELSRQQAGRLNLQIRTSGIGQIVRNVVAKLQSRSKIHCLKCDLPPALPAVLADSMRVERIFHNLIDNAIKYSPNGGEVRISVRQLGDYVISGVSDNGPGIPEEDQPGLFQSFERLGALVKGDIPGTGLGLRVCRILVEAHGGKIWVDSGKGRGSTFFFTLPAVKVCG